MARQRRPVKHRHFPIEEIGSELWWRQLAKLRVSRADVERNLEEAAQGRARSEIDPHAVSPATGRRRRRRRTCCWPGTSPPTRR